MLKLLRQAGIRQKADERILGDGDFVSEVLRDAQERLNRKYQLMAEGYDFEKIESIRGGYNAGML